MSLLRRWTTVLLIVVGSVASFLATTGTAQSAPAKPSQIVKVVHDGPQQDTLTVYSAAMGKSFPVEVLTPRDRSTPSPVFYLLNGAGGGEDGATWAARTDYKKYFADKKTFVVTPVGGAASYYTDWIHDDPELGRVKWQTFLTKELPPLIDRHFSTTGRNAIGGISMSGTSVLNLAIAAPKLYRAVGAFSGCARTTDPLGEAYVRIVVESFSTRKVSSMWGPPGGPVWRANDPYLNAAKLRGTKIYMTSGNGLPGPHETLQDPSVKGDAAWLANQTLVGGVLESAVGQCTGQMARRLADLHIPADVSVRPNGTHSWGYWQDDLRRTWPKIARDLAS
ncbi:alpha/beta hydrolase family protein [Gordonia hankookensis]